MSTPIYPLLEAPHLKKKFIVKFGTTNIRIGHMVFFKGEKDILATSFQIKVVLLGTVVKG